MTINRQIQIIVGTLFFLAGCTQLNTIPASSEPTSQASAETQLSEQTKIADTKIFQSDQYHFSLEYPSSWTVTNNEQKGMGMIIAANDQQDEWGGTNLNLNFKYDAGDVGMGWKVTKPAEQYTNPQGIKLTLSFYALDENFDTQSAVDANDVMILIWTDAIPGLKEFGYNKQVNPEGEQQLRDILDTLTKS